MATAQPLLVNLILEKVQSRDSFVWLKCLSAEIKCSCTYKIRKLLFKSPLRGDSILKAKLPELLVVNSYMYRLVTMLYVVLVWHSRICADACVARPAHTIFIPCNY